MAGLLCKIFDCPSQDRRLLAETSRVMVVMIQYIRTKGCEEEFERLFLPGRSLAEMEQVTQQLADILPQRK